MKNKIKYIIYTFIGSTLLCLNVNAATIDIKTDTTRIKKDLEASLSLKKAANESITKIEFKIEYDNTSIKIGSLTNESGYLNSQIGSDNLVYVQAPKDEITDGVFLNIPLENLKKTTGSTAIKLKDIKYFDSSNNEIPSTEKEKSLTLNLRYEENIVKNSEAKVDGFSISNATMKPNFSKDVMDYKLYVKDTIEKITIKAQEAAGSQYEINCTSGCRVDSQTPNKLKLEIGKNEATIVYTSEDGKNTATYNFIIYRGETADGSKYLKDLSVENFKLAETFNKSNLDYTLTIDYETVDLNIIATPEDDAAVVSIKGNQNLQVGENVITITVTSAETNEKSIYNITVTREDFKPTETTTQAIIEKTDNKKKNKTWLIIVIALLASAIIGVSAYFIFFKDKHDNKKKEKQSTKDKKIDKKDELKDNESISVNENELKEELNSIEENKAPSVDDALADLMKTKELELTKEIDLNDL